MECSLPRYKPGLLIGHLQVLLSKWFYYFLNNISTKFRMQKLDTWIFRLLPIDVSRMMSNVHRVM